MKWPFKPALTSVRPTWCHATHDLTSLTDVTNCQPHSHTKCPSFYRHTFPPTRNQGTIYWVPQSIVRFEYISENIRIWQHLYVFCCRPGSGSLYFAETRKPEWSEERDTILGQSLEIRSMGLTFWLQKWKYKCCRFLYMSHIQTWDVEQIESRAWKVAI